MSMTDPTAIILTGAFVLACAIALGGGLFKAMLRRGPAEGLVEAGSQEDSPFDPPREGAPPLPPAAGGVRVDYYRPFDLLGVIFVFAVFGGLAMASLTMKENEAAALSLDALVSSIAFQFIMAGIVTVLVIPRVDPVEWLGLRWRSWPWVFLIAPGAVLGMWVVFGGLQLSGYVKWMESLGVETVQDAVKLLRDTEDPRVLGLMAFAAVVAAPLCEEIVFRGYFYPVLKRFTGLWPAALCSSLVFSCAHGNLTAALPLFLFGGLLVWLYEKTGSLWAPVAVHFCFNGATVLIQLAARHFDLPIQSAP